MHGRLCALGIEHIPGGKVSTLQRVPFPGRAGEAPLVLFFILILFLY